MRNRTLKHLLCLLPALIALLVLASAGTAAAEEPGRIVGSVSAEGFAIGGIEVCAIGYEGAVINKTTCAESKGMGSGSFIIPNLAPGKYLVYFEPGSQNYVAQYWENAENYGDATPVTVASGPVYGISANLVRGATISGTVTAAATGAPVEGVEACALDENEDAERCGFTDAAGKYTIPGLFEEGWSVRFYPYNSGQNFIYQRYPTEIPVHTKQVVTGIDAALVAGGQIGGTVTLAATGAPLAGVRVCIVKAVKLATYECLKTSASGAYDFIGIEAGSWKIAFSPETDELIQENPYQGEVEELTEAADAYPTQWWNAKPSFATAESIAITPPQIVTGIDAKLGPPAAVVTMPAPPAVAPPVAKPVTKAPLICHKNFAKRKVKGKLRCVRRHPKKHHHRRHHKRHRAL